MRKFSYVFSFYFRESFLSKRSLITSSILFLVVFGVFALNHFTYGKDTDKEKLSIIADSSMFEVNEKALNNSLPSATIKIVEKDSLSKLRKQVEDGEIDGLFHIKDSNGNPELIYLYKNEPNQKSLMAITNYFQQQYTNLIVNKNNVSSEIAMQLQSKVSVKAEAVKDRSSAFGIGYIFIFILYAFMAAFGNVIAMNIASEKSSRVMEVMLSKVKPLNMMYAKILAVVTTALLQITILACGIIVPYLMGWIDVNNPSVLGLHLEFSKLDTLIISMFIIYFILGYLLYALMYAAAGALVSKIEDLQSTAMPVMIFIVSSFIIGMKSLADPTGTISVYSSYIPFFSPMVTYARIVMGEAGSLEIGITLAILVLTIIVLNFITSRIYTNGVMNYSDKLKLKDISKFLKKY
ncbi:ABC transporter permease [Bacillus cereus]|nr:ABC transporter permease [Bacillus cereus]HDR7736273.1 ABC transporter permease [Bacillus thuringiensis]